MLFKNDVLRRIKRGEVTLAFRRWRRPSVKAGTILHTTVGILEVLAVENLPDADAITARDCRLAGFADLAALQRTLAGHEGDLHRITLRYAGDDPRVRLREDVECTDAEVDAILAKLAALDKRSADGPWTRRVLEHIAAHPMQPAAEVAAALGIEKECVKLDVRKLKNLGLTISHTPGYEISPRGRLILARLRSV